MNFSFWLLSIVLIYKTVLKMSDSKVASLASVVFFINLGNIAMIHQTYSETMYAFLLCSMCYFLYAFFSGKGKFFFLLAFCSGILVRPTCSVLIFILPLYFLLLYKKELLNLKNIFISVVIVFFMLAPTIFSMYKYYKTATISNIGVMAYYGYLSSYSTVIFKYSTFKEASDASGKITKERWSEIYGTKTNNEVDWAKIEEIAALDFKKQLNNNAFNLLMAFGKNVFSSSKGYSNELNKCKNIKNYFGFNVYHKTSTLISQLQNILHSFNILIFSPFILFKKRKKRFENPVFYFFTTINFIAACIIILSGFSYGQGDRFNIVTVPISIILGVFWYDTYFRKNSKQFTSNNPYKPQNTA
jgi:hypothetical protein